MKISFNCTDDQQVVHTHKDAGLSDQVPCSKPDISPEAYLNDYRNRMPFHYIEEGSDGYYYWQYGSIMDLVINFVDEIAQSEDMPEAVLDVRINDKSVVDPVAGIAHLGSMALAQTSEYYTLNQTNKIVSTLSSQIAELQEGAVTVIIQDSDSLMRGQLLMWDPEARRLVGSPLVKGDAEKSIILKTSSDNPNFASHEGAVLLGRGLRSSFPYQFITGYYNNLTPEEVFSVGTGFSNETRSTAFSISRSGEVRAFNPPINNEDVARLNEINSLQTQLDSGLAKKLDKVTTQTPYSQVYSKSSDGSQLMLDYTSEAVSSTLVQRKADGHITLPDSFPLADTDATSKRYIDSKFELDAVFQNNLIVKGNLTVSGSSTVIDTETVSVKDNFILTNSNRVSLIDLSGLVINKDNVSAYGIVLDPEDELLKLGLGKVSEDGTFNFLPNQAQPLATRNYVNAALDNKVDKKTNAYILYGTDKNGNQKEYRVTSSAAGGDQIPIYDATSGEPVLRTNTPRTDLDAANKKYVDDGLGKKLDLIEPLGIQVDFVMVVKDENGYRQVQRGGTYTPQTDYPEVMPVLRGVNGQIKGQTPPLDKQTDLDLINRGELKDKLKNKLNLIEPTGVQTEFVMVRKEFDGTIEQVQKTGIFTPRTSYSDFTPVLRGLQGQLRGQTAPLAQQNDLDLINRAELTEKLSDKLSTSNIGQGLSFSDNKVNANIAKIQASDATEFVPDENGVVTIPNGSRTNFGLFKSDYANGIQSPNGVLRIWPANKVDINNRANGFDNNQYPNGPMRPIVYNAINYVVKAALTDDKRIGTETTAPTTFTDTEKDRACEILGATRYAMKVTIL